MTKYKKARFRKFNGSTEWGRIEVEEDEHWNEFRRAEDGDDLHIHYERERLVKLSTVLTVNYDGSTTEQQVTLLPQEAIKLGQHLVALGTKMAKETTGD